MRAFGKDSPSGINDFPDLSILTPYDINRSEVVEHFILAPGGLLLTDGRRGRCHELEGGQAIGNSHLSDGLRHQFCTINVGVVKFSGWFREVGQRVVALIGIRPVLGINDACRGYVVGREYVVALT